MRMLIPLMLIALVGCSPDPEKIKLQKDCSKFQREIINLNSLLSAEKTPQVEMVEKMEKLAAQHRADLAKLQGKIDFLNKEMVEKEVSPALVGLQIKLKELDKRDAVLTAEIVKLYKLCKDLEENKSNRGHGH
jgi:predicted  nucleic acid-binding Zn-ribbon protein